MGVLAKSKGHSRSGKEGGGAVRNRMFGYVLVVSLLCIGIMIPGVGSADTKKFSCNDTMVKKGVCVKAILNTLDIKCVTTSDGRPKCWAKASAGAAAKQSPIEEPDPLTSGYSATFSYDIKAFAGNSLIRGSLFIGGRQFTRTAMDPRSVRSAHYSNGGDMPYDGTTSTLTEQVRTPEITGPVGGCVNRFVATFRVHAFAHRGPIGLPGETASSEHNHGVGPRTYCVEDTR